MYTAIHMIILHTMNLFKLLHTYGMNAMNL